LGFFYTRNLETGLRFYEPNPFFTPEI